MPELNTDFIEKRIRKYRIFLLFVLFCSILAIAAMELYLYDQKIPSVIYLKDREEKIDLHVPAKAELIEVVSHGEDNIPKENLVIDLREKVAVPMEDAESCTLQVKLFGFWSLKKMKIRLVENRELIPVGLPVGIYMETNGLLVVGTGAFRDETGTDVSPVGQILFSGDYILTVDGQAITDKRELIGRINEGDGEGLELGVVREGVLRKIRVTPQKDSNGEYKLGVWIRDNTQGVGTLTFLAEDGKFGALGHGINDIDTNELLTISGGTLYETKIVDVKKGVPGDPGEMTGMIVYTDEHILGKIIGNDKRGIFGEINSYGVEKFSGQEALPIGLKQEIRKGYAQILSGIDETPKLYDAEITEIHMDRDNVNRGIELKITDERLIKKTGGIIQGMSGSPIIQNGKIIGAVTHVLVNDPKRGYGIFIEEMLNTDVIP